MGIVDTAVLIFGRHRCEFCVLFCVCGGEQSLGTNVVPTNIIHETSTEVLLKFGAERVSKCKVQYHHMRPYHCTFVLNSDVAYVPSVQFLRLEVLYRVPTVPYCTVLHL